MWTRYAEYGIKYRVYQLPACGAVYQCGIGVESKFIGREFINYILKIALYSSSRPIYSAAAYLIPCAYRPRPKLIYKGYSLEQLVCLYRIPHTVCMVN